MSKFTLAELRAICMYKSNDLPFHYKIPWSEDKISQCNISSLSEIYKKLYEIYLRAKRSADYRIYIRDRCYDENTRKQSYIHPIQQALKHQRRAEELMRYLTNRMMNFKSENEHIIDEPSHCDLKMGEDKVKPKRKNKGNNRVKAVKAKVSLDEDKDDEIELFKNLEENLKAQSKDEISMNELLTAILHEYKNILLPYDVELDIDHTNFVMSSMLTAWETYNVDTSKGLYRAVTKLKSLIDIKDAGVIRAFKDWYIPTLIEFKYSVILPHFGIHTEDPNKHCCSLSDMDLIVMVKKSLYDTDPTLRHLYFDGIIDIYHTIKHDKKFQHMVSSTSVSLVIAGWLRDHIIISENIPEDPKRQEILFKRKSTKYLFDMDAFEFARRLCINIAFGEKIKIRPFSSWYWLNLVLTDDYNFFFIMYFTALLNHTHTSNNK